MEYGVGLRSKVPYCLGTLNFFYFNPSATQLRTVRAHTLWNPLTLPLLRREHSQPLGEALGSVPPPCGAAELRSCGAAELRSCGAAEQGREG
jgi:hypothetical protein